MTAALALKYSIEKRSETANGLYGNCGMISFSHQDCIPRFQPVGFEIGGLSRLEPARI